MMGAVMMSEIDDLESTIYPEGYAPLDPIKLSAAAKRKRGLYQYQTEKSLRNQRISAADRRRQVAEPSLPRLKFLERD